MKQIAIASMLVALLAGCGPRFREVDRVATPRENAASQLTLQGTQLLNAGKPDNALRLFEQAIGLDPANGRCYYYMAQAWLAKGRFQEAREFNTLAREYLKNNAAWENRVVLQAEQIEEQSDSKR